MALVSRACAFRIVTCAQSAAGARPVASGKVVERYGSTEEQDDSKAVLPNPGKARYLHRCHLALAGV